MRHAHFDIVIDSPQRLVIRDLGPWDHHPSVTNDAEWVVEQLANRLDGRVLLYFDSEGDLGRLCVERGCFAGYAPWTADL